MIVVYSDDVVGNFICVIHFIGRTKFWEEESQEHELKEPKIIDITKMLKNLDHRDQFIELWSLVEEGDIEDKRIEICFNFINNLSQNISPNTNLVKRNEYESPKHYAQERRF